jgi:hypothetical protein
VHEKILIIFTIDFELVQIEFPSFVRKIKRKKEDRGGEPSERKRGEEKLLSFFLCVD